MKKTMRFATICLVLVFAAVTALSASAAECKPQITSYDNGQVMWWVGTNITCTPTEDTGFTLKSIDGTSAGADVAWGFTYGQLKQTPYFHVGIANTEAEEGSVYTKLFALVNNSSYVFFDPFTSTVENWVHASSVSGRHAIDLKAAADEAQPSLADDALIILFLYVSHDGLDPVSNDTLTVTEFYLSDTESTSADTGDTGSDTGSQNDNQGSTGADTGADPASAFSRLASIDFSHLLLLPRQKG
ncbi:MAG: hypothetical protein IKI50_07215 [Clostridia bacterium]|nr:hypothetical protein [Clostridia bacterium]